MRYIIRMYNEVDCLIDSGMIIASNEYDALEKFKEKHRIIEYPGDRYEIVEV